MKKINLAAVLMLSVSIIFGCQTLGIREVVTPAGVYLITLSTPMGEMESTLAINADGTGYLEGMMGKMEFSDAKLEGNNFNIPITMESQMGEMKISFEGAVDGDNISGISKSEMGEATFTGQRKE